MTESDINGIFNTDFEGICDMCGVCCTHVSINSQLPDGSSFVKPSGQTCGYLEDNKCSVWGREDVQPDVCRTIRPTNSLCRFDLRDEPNGRESHIIYLQELDSLTDPNS